MPPRPRPHWLGRLVADPWRKLTALALATVLWLWLDSQVVKKTFLDCRLVAVDAESTAAPVLRTNESVLELRVPVREYSPGAFADAADGRPISHVRVHFSGAAHVIATILPGERLFVEPTHAQLGEDSPVIEFDRGWLRGRHDMVLALTGMEPPRLRIALERNGFEDVRLSLAHVALKPPATNGETWLPRIDRDAAAFSPSVVTLRGTRRALAALDLGGALFDADLSDPAAWSGREIRCRLSPTAILKQARVEASPSYVQATIPLRPDFHQIAVEVPVVVDVQSTSLTPADLAPVADHPVTLFVTGSLETLLTAKAADELQAWVESNLRVLATLPRSSSAERIPPVVAKLIFVNDDGWKDGVDYRVEMLPVVVSLRKQ